MHMQALSASKRTHHRSTKGAFYQSLFFFFFFLYNFSQNCVYTYGYAYSFAFLCSFISKSLTRIRALEF